MSSGAPTWSPKNPGWRYADDGDPLSADLDALPEYRRIPCEAARPEAFADHGDGAVWAAAAGLGIVRWR